MAGAVASRGLLSNLTLLQFEKFKFEINYTFRVSSSARDVLILAHIVPIPEFRDFTIRDPRYFMIQLQWKLAKKVDFRIFF